ncbi:T9SS type A sorting domain-containing protein [Winogradskyella sediminis]|uniref:T9SS type A sorting domain-containing protein n=1 Tax=Winogradskyella sediminis TaxID=1382466 RepID=UPI000E284491|nr:T9SS type A sorting domain-containing protein [Winogradskyella sediminis]REG89275.1 putative secreted protein (Por secretion system target) [Winogradskyella sediminis]
MKTIITFVSSKKVLTTFLLLLSALSFSQVVTDIFPTRVTNGSVITILGTGFYDGLEEHIDSGYSGQSEATFVSSTEMTIKITVNQSSDYTRQLTVDGATINSGVDNNIHYVGPTNKTLTTTSSFRIVEMYTTWDHDGDGEGFWKSSYFNSSDKSTWPNDRHDLLGFKMNYGSGDIIFSTGVDDELLEDKLVDEGIDITDPTKYISQEFKAYSSRGITGKPHSSNFLAMADLIDGVENGRVLNSNVLATVYDVIIDGVNGLDLGTGITNFNKDAEIKFYSGNGNVGAIDTVPDLVITQMAQPGGSGARDIYYYADVQGNVVGRPIRLRIDSNSQTRIYEWELDLYRLDLSSSVTYDNAYPNQSSFGTREHRPFTMVAFKLQDFGIDATNIEDVNNVNMAAGGSSDMAFMAYNKAAFEIKSPVITDAPVSRYFCRFPTSSNITFEATGAVEGGYSTPADSDETITYQWFENFAPMSAKSETIDAYTFASGLTEAQIENKIFKVRVENAFGAIDIPFTISKGGTPTYWDGSDWILAPIYDGLTIKDEDKSLIFSNNYSESADLFGCDCTVSAGKVVTIPSGSKMTLVNTLTVEEEIPEFIEDGVTSPAVDAGIFTLEDDASLVQINNVENSGEIIKKRTVDGTTLNGNDYIYWSSPVEDASFSSIPGNVTYEWHTNGANSISGTSGNWASASGTMSVGRGYIARVPQAIDYTATFNGVPNNGEINWSVYRTGSVGSMKPVEIDWNLIGNPYPSSINAIKFLEDNTDIEGSVYLWTHNRAATSSESDPFYNDSYGINYGDQYVAYNALGTSDPAGEFDGNIASGQGFFVQINKEIRNNTSSFGVTFTNDMRYDANEIGFDNSQFYRSSSDETIVLEKQLIWLSLVNENNKAMSTLVGYTNGATEGKDRLYDAYTNNEGFNLYSLISEDEKLVIQGLPLPFADSNTVPLGIEIEDSGIYQIAIGKVEGNLFEELEQDIYLEDTYTGVVHDLRSSPYSFTGEAGEFNDRFILRYTNSSTLSTTEVAVSDTFAYINNATLYLKSSSLIKSATLYDMNGKQITNYNVNNNDNSFITEFRFSKGIYIVAITLDNGTVVTKKLIN